MSSETRVEMIVDVDVLDDPPAVEWLHELGDRDGEREVVVVVTNTLTLTFESRFALLGWLQVIARQYELQWGKPEPARPAEPEHVDELGTPMAYGRGKPPRTNRWSVP